MSDTVLVAKRGYVSMMRAVRSVVESLGMGRVAVNAREHRYRHWLQSLLAIHDIDALIRLDVPWWTYDAIERVDAFLAARPGARVFEWGSGASTVWLAKRAESVISIDHDAPWVEFSAPRLAERGNARVELVPVDAQADRDPQFLSGKPGYAGQTFRSYVEAIDRHEGRFDLIVIDGRARAACLERAIDRLARGGLIVFDNSHRVCYRKAIVASGLRAKVTRGLVPSLPLPDQTTLLRR